MSQIESKAKKGPKEAKMWLTFNKLMTLVDKSKIKAKTNYMISKAYRKHDFDAEMFMLSH